MDLDEALERFNEVSKPADTKTQYSFSKLKNGGWGIKARGSARPNPGDEVLVTKKDGSTTPVILGRQLYANDMEALYRKSE